MRRYTMKINIRLVLMSVCDRMFYEKNNYKDCRLYNLRKLTRSWHCFEFVELTLKIAWTGKFLSF